MRKLLYSLFIILILVAGFSLPVHSAAWDGATAHYIRPGASYNGDGSTWAAATSAGGVGAYNAIPAVLQRGHVYYVADGTLPGYTFNDVVSGAQWIYFVKATEADHGTSTGWVSTLGDGQFVFSSPISIASNCGYLHIDGQSRTGWETGYGIKVDGTGTGDTVYLTAGGTISYVYLYYVDIDGNTTNDNGYEANLASGSNHIISHCYLHDFVRCQILTSHVTDVIVEYNQMSRNHYSTTAHSESISAGLSVTTNYVVRYNIFEDIAGTAGTIIAGDYIYIYGNLAINKGNSPLAPTNDHTTNGFYAAWTYSNHTWFQYNHVYIYNNTFAYLKGTCGLGGNEVAYSNTAYNNIWYQCGTETIHSSFTTTANNNINQSDVFVNAANYDFRLATAVTPATVLGSPYDTDILGNQRGGDGVWDRGAYEFVSGSDTTPPTVSAASIATNGQTVTVSFSENVSTAGYDNGDFDLDCTIAGGNIPLNSIAGTGSSRTFTAGVTINNGDVCNLDYTGTLNEIEDPSGNDLAVFIDRSVTNNSTQGSDTTPPVVNTASIGSDGQTITITFSEDIVTTGYDNGDFDFDCLSGGNNIALNSVQVLTNTSRNFTAAAVIHVGDTCTLDYSGGGDDVEDLAGNDLLSFQDRSVTNNSSQSAQANRKKIKLGNKHLGIGAYRLTLQ